MRITTDSVWESNPSIAQLSNGDILVAYQRWGARVPKPDSGCWIALRRSTDHGLSWSEAETLSGNDRTRPLVRRARNGEVMLFWLTGPVQSGPHHICYAQSWDGTLWSVPETLPVPADSLCQSSGRFFQPDDYRYWVFYQRGGTSCWLRGEYGEWQPETLAPAVGGFGSMVQDATGKLWCFGGSGGAPLYRTSSDTGRTWSALHRVMSARGNPRVELDSNGGFHMGFAPVASWPGLTDILAAECPAGDTVWTAAESVTTYCGFDSLGDVARVNGEPWIVFASGRGANSDIYCGVLGQTADSAPPPCLLSLGVDQFPTQGCRFTVRAEAIDEDGIDSVNLVYMLNGIPQPDLQLLDDGRHGDGDSADHIFGNFLGPYPRGAPIQASCQCRVVDRTGNRLLGPDDPCRFEILGVHDTSMFALRVDPWNGIDAMGEWPRGSDSNYLYAGHCWVGAKTGPDSFVSDFNPNSGGTDWSVCEGDSLRWFTGASDLESRVRLDDRLPASGQPLGIKLNKHTLSWCRHPYDDFAIQEYTIGNTGLHGDLDSVFIGFCYDFDVLSGSDDMAGHDTLRQVSYMYDQWSTGWVGVRMLSGQLRGTDRWTLDTDPVNDGARYAKLVRDSLMAPAIGWSDFRVLQTSGPWRMMAGDSVRIAIALVIGPGLAGLQENSDTAQAVYDRGYLTSVGDDDGLNGLRLALDTVGPNPIRGSAKIRFSLPAAGHVRLRVLDVTGRVVRTVLNAEAKSGTYSLDWDCTDDRRCAVPAGVYVYRLEIGFRAVSRRVVLTR